MLPRATACMAYALSNNSRAWFENFSKPVLISAPGIDDKDAALFPEMIDGQYVFVHRVQPSIHLSYVKSLSDFDGEHFFKIPLDPPLQKGEVASSPLS